ncbi:MBL fold metallo-hydrolase [Streptococcus sp. H49]|uniref:MBL fold metallo-hydrolase n=1 Tax=Streptococcus huangxiaojuni TaxID=3237239 RepID=UPI0034A4E817
MSDTIQSLDYFACGSCSNQAQLLFKDVPKEKFIFPAGVFLIKHRIKGYILYDTGYGYPIMSNKLKYLLYRAPNPIVLKPEQTVSRQLADRGIAPEAISYIILSHLHPDHIGDVRQFPQAQFIITQDCFAEYQRGRRRSLIFREFLPDDFTERLLVIRPHLSTPDFPFLPVYDLFGDSSLLLTALSGHADGQCCLFLPEKDFFIAADVTWGIPLLPLTKQMRLLPRLIQNDFGSYQKNAALLEEIMAAGIKVAVSHDQEKRIRSLLR